MKATARRIGRIVGALDDLAVQLDLYRISETHGGQLQQKLTLLEYAVQEAHAQAEALTQYLNQRDKKDPS